MGWNSFFRYGKRLLKPWYYFQGVRKDNNRAGFGIEIHPSGSYKIGEWKGYHLHGFISSNKMGTKELY